LNTLASNSTLILVLATDLVFSSCCRSPWLTQMRSIREISQPSSRLWKRQWGNSEINSPLLAISISHMVPHAPSASPRPVPRRPRPRKITRPSEGKFEVGDPVFPITPPKVDDTSMEAPKPQLSGSEAAATSSDPPNQLPTSSIAHSKVSPSLYPYCRGLSNQPHFWSFVILTVDAGRPKVLQKRLQSDSHQVAHATNG